jgi:hypothetical protein
MADLNEGLDKALEKTKELEATTAKIKENLSAAGEASGSIGGQSSTQVANKSSSQNPGGGFGSSGYSSFGAGTNTGAPTSTPSMPERFKSADDRSKLSGALKSAITGSVATVGAVAAFAPTTQEAVLVNQLAERIRFYSGVGTTAQRGYDIQKQASNQGTAISPYDAAYAGNFLAGNGLMPGLKNFRAGNNYTGILGGAALASNLAPGIGITGGAQAMSGINTAYNVNMLRMFGVQVRNSNGSGMNDLSSIIDRVYEILSRGKDISEEDIAIAAMSGNSLDSIINQYFGGDPQIRQVIIAGLIQKSKGKSFSKKALLGTGGLTTGAETTSNRSTAELQMIQNLSEPVLQGLTRTNNMLQTGYGALTKLGSSGVGKTVLNITTMMETLAGARGGAGALLTDAISGGRGGLALSALAAGKLGTDAYKGMKGSNTTLLDIISGKGKTSVFGTSPTDVSGVDITGQTQASPAGPLYTGAITINVSAPLSADPYAFASAITQAMTART